MTPLPASQAGPAAPGVMLVGFAGGLALSGIKRDPGVADRGDAIRGHGGVLDRVDSLLLPAPVFYRAPGGLG